MEFIIIILIIVIIILLTYLFLYHNEVKHILKEIDNIKDLDSNTLIHSKYNLKNINNLIYKINNLLTESKNIKIDYGNKNKSLMKMMTNISHDLRTPLTSALGYIDIILKSDLSEEEKKKDLITIEKRLRRLEELISSFFEFSKIISTNKRPALEKINLTSVLEESVIVFYDDYNDASIYIKLSNVYYASNNNDETEIEIKFNEYADERFKYGFYLILSSLLKWVQIMWFKSKKAIYFYLNIVLNVDILIDKKYCILYYIEKGNIIW